MPQHPGEDGECGGGGGAGGGGGRPQLRLPRARLGAVQLGPRLLVRQHPPGLHTLTPPAGGHQVTPHTAHTGQQLWRSQTLHQSCLGEGNCSSGR